MVGVSLPTNPVKEQLPQLVSEIRRLGLRNMAVAPWLSAADAGAWKPPVAGVQI